VGQAHGVDPVPLSELASVRAKQTIVIVALLALGSVLAHYHVANQSYFPVSKLASADGYTFHMVQDRVAQRGACGEANDRFLAPLKKSCAHCSVVYARCERELHGLELALLLGDPVPMYVVIAPGLRLSIEGPAARVRADCEHIAANLVQAGAPSAGCVFPGTLRRP
jgi:hypothetical protein